MIAFHGGSVPFSPAGLPDVVDVSVSTIVKKNRPKSNLLPFFFIFQGAERESALPGTRIVNPDRNKG
jgi:hypothetical protein